MAVAAGAGTGAEAGTAGVERTAGMWVVEAGTEAVKRQLKGGSLGAEAAAWTGTGTGTGIAVGAVNVELGLQQAEKRGRRRHRRGAGSHSAWPPAVSMKPYDSWN